jgi:hypothetical protein
MVQATYGNRLKVGVKNNSYCQLIASWRLKSSENCYVGYNRWRFEYYVIRTLIRHNGQRESTEACKSKGAISQRDVLHTCIA